MKPPPQNRAEARAEIAKRNALAREQDALAKCAQAQDAAIAAALNPEGGWWRPHAIRGRGLTLCKAAALNAHSVGASRKQIADASGASIRAVNGALCDGKAAVIESRQPDEARPRRRDVDWAAVFAESRGLTTAQIARKLRVPDRTVLAARRRLNLSD